MEEINIAMQQIANECPTRIVSILKSRNYKNVYELYEFYEKTLCNYTSNYLFPNELVAFYPQIIERKSLKNIVCALSGQIIEKGSYYCTYHPFIEILSSKKVYTIKKKIKTSLEYIDYFPIDLYTYEQWYYKLKNAYFETNIENSIDFYHLSISCGEHCLEPYALRLSKTKKNKL